MQRNNTCKYWWVYDATQSKTNTVGYVYIYIYIYIYTLSWKQCAFPVITTMALWQLIHALAHLDGKLKFKDHGNFMCKKASQKLYALARIAPFMDSKQRRNNMKAFSVYQFGYCLLIWMFNSRGLDNKIYHIHERVLRITYKSKSSTFQIPLEKGTSYK